MTIEDDARTEAEQTQRGVFIDGNPFSITPDAWVDGYVEGFVAAYRREPSEPEGDKQLWRHTLSYAAVALEGSGDNGDRYCARRIRDHLAQTESTALAPSPGTSKSDADHLDRETADADSRAADAIQRLKQWEKGHRLSGSDAEHLHALIDSYAEVAGLRTAFSSGAAGSHCQEQITEVMIEAFKTEWHAADAEGDEGNRVRRGLKAAEEARHG